MVSPFNLRDVATLRGTTLTPEQMQERHNILAEKEEELDDAGKQLSPRSQKELTELTNLLVKSKNTYMTGEQPICRLTAPHYFVKFPNPAEQKVTTFRNLNNQIQEIPIAPLNILRGIQSEDLNWFSREMKVQGEVVESDFMDSLYNSFVANANLLRAAALLASHPKEFKGLLEVYTASFNLYQDQLTFSRSVQTNTLKNAKISYQKLEELIPQIFELCGPTLEENPAVLNLCKTIDEGEKRAIVKYNKALDTHCTEFVQKIESLEKEVQKYCTSISEKQTAVQEAIGKLTRIEERKKALYIKEQNIQQELDRFRQAKRDEIDSIKVVEVGGCNIKFLGIPIYSEKPEKKMVRESFGSDKAYRDYLQGKQEGAALTTEIAQAQKELAQAMRTGGFSNCPMEERDMQQVSDYLATALMSLSKMKSSLYERRTEARNRITYITTLLESEDERSFSSIRQVLFFMRDMRDRIVQRHATWVASNRESLAVKLFREKDSVLMLRVTDALSQGPAAIQSLQSDIQAILPSVSNSQEANAEIITQFKQLLPSNQKMLLEYSRET